MNLILIRNQSRPDGIFSTLTSEDGHFTAVTLEHAYLVNNQWLPKIYDGTFTCVRGTHQLENMKSPFETFEITGVIGHTNLLFHMGNWDKDSSGCILLGENIALSSQGQMVTSSDAVFEKFMSLQAGVQSFTLKVATQKS